MSISHVTISRKDLIVRISMAYFMITAKMIRFLLLRSRWVTACAGVLILPAFFVSSGFAQISKPLKIWDEAPHSAFTDLIHFEGKWYCTFREAPGHVPVKEGEDGKVRVIVSEDGDYWESFALLSLDKYDLRDPKICRVDDGKLMISMGASEYDGSKLVSRLTYVSFLNRSRTGFTDPKPVKIDAKIKSDNDWLWRVTWHGKLGYGVVYQIDDHETIHLVRTRNGLRYSLVTSMKVSGEPNEATIRFLSNDRMVILLRREGGDQEGYIGVSEDPYERWFWRKIGFRIGGPDLLILSDVSFLAGARAYERDDHYTALYIGNLTSKWKEAMHLPSSGDTSYPGIFIYGDEIWVSYYSSHEGKAAIYLAKIPIEIITG